MIRTLMKVAVLATGTVALLVGIRLVLPATLDRVRAWQAWEIIGFQLVLVQLIATIATGITLGRDLDRPDQEQAIALIWLIGAMTGMALPYLGAGTLVQPLTLPLQLWLVVPLARMQRWKAMRIALAGCLVAVLSVSFWLPRLA